MNGRMNAVLAISLLLAVLPSRSLGSEKHTAAAGPDGVQRVEVLGGEYFFKPDHIVVKKDVPVELIVRKEKGVTPHNIVMEGFGEDGKEIRTPIYSSEAKVIAFTPRAAGTFKFYCDKRFLFFKDHRAKGMDGVLEVVE